MLRLLPVELENLFPVWLDLPSKRLTALFTYRWLWPLFLNPPLLTDIPWNSSSFVLSFVILQDTSPLSFIFLIILTNIFKLNFGSCRASTSCDAALRPFNYASRSKLFVYYVMTHGIFNISGSLIYWMTVCTFIAVLNPAFSGILRELVPSSSLTT